MKLLGEIDVELALVPGRAGQHQRLPLLHLKLNRSIISLDRESSVAYPGRYPTDPDLDPADGKTDPDPAEILHLFDKKLKLFFFHPYLAGTVCLQ